MGTSGAYGGSGGKDGDALRDAVGDYLDAQAPSGEEQGINQLAIDPAALARVLNLIRPRIGSGGGADGPGRAGGGGGDGSSGGGRRNGGPQRSVAQSARTAGRAAAAAYAYRTGNTTVLEGLGLDYAELAALGNQFEVLRRIVDMACQTPDSTIEDHEQRLVAADVAEWVMGQEDDGYVPTPEEIVRQTIALIISEVVLSETGDLLNRSDHGVLADQDIRDASEALAQRAILSVAGTTDEEIARAVEDGIATLRTIVGARA